MSSQAQGSTGAHSSPPNTDGSSHHGTPSTNITLLSPEEAPVRSLRKDAGFKKPSITIDTVAAAEEDQQSVLSLPSGAFSLISY